MKAADMISSISPFLQLDLHPKHNKMTAAELLLQLLGIITNPMDTGAGKTNP